MENRQRIAKFEKVSFEQYKKDYLDTFGETTEEEIIKQQQEFVECHQNQ